MRISDWSSDVCSSDLSSLRSAHDHPRNLDEGRLKALAAKGGAMCISTIYMSEMNMSPERAKLFGEYEHIGEMTPEAQAELTRQWRDRKSVRVGKECVRTCRSRGWPIH